jgi:type I restriction enzyme M protein
MADRTHRVITDTDVQRIANTYHAWRREADAGAYEDIAGFCKDSPLDRIRGHGYVLTPGRYVGMGDVEDDGEPFEEKMERLVDRLYEQNAKSDLLDGRITSTLEGLGYGR